MAKNIILMYGQQACEHLPKLLNTWSLLLNNAAEWQSCCFVLVTDDGTIAHTVPAGAAPFVQGRIVTLSPRNLANAAEAVQNHIRNTVQGNNPVMLYCICSGSGNGELDGNALNTFLVKLMNVYNGGLHPVLFDLITSEISARYSQYVFLDAVCKNQMDQQMAFYLLSDTDYNNDRVDVSTQWTALDNEVGRNVKSLVNMIPGTVYSLGYVALNPDRMELVSIQERALLEKIILPCLEEQKQEDPAGLIWKVFSNNHHEFPLRDTADPVIKKWIERMIGNSLVFPAEEKLRNNRIFGDVYQGQFDPRQYSLQIMEFFRANISYEKFEERAEAYFSHKFARMLNDLASAYLDRRAYGMLEKLQKMLRYFADANLPEFAPPALDDKRFLCRESQYRDQCCTRIEEKAKIYYLNEAIKKMAGIMIDKLERFKTFCNGRNGFVPPFAEHVIDHGQYENLVEKYPEYCKKICTEVDFHAVALRDKLQQLNLSLFRADGSVDPENWYRALVMLQDELVLKLNDNRTYLQVVSDEKPTDQEFAEFLNSYLGGTKRMLLYSGGAGFQETHFIVDDDLKKHNWYQVHRDSVSIVDNDNVERVDRYTLPLNNNQSILGLLAINNNTFPYFSANRTTTTPDDGLVDDGVILHTVQVESIHAATNTDGAAVNPQNNVTKSAANAHFDMQITLQRNQNNNLCQVHWVWPPKTTNMVLTIYKDNRVEMGPFPVQTPHTSYQLQNLPYGPIQIVLDGRDTDNKMYKDAVTVAGMQDRVCYHISNGKHQRVRITLAGGNANLNEVQVKNTAPDGSVTIYPVVAHGTGQYDDLILHGTVQVQVNPQLKYPRVRVMPG